MAELTFVVAGSNRLALEYARKWGINPADMRYVPQGRALESIVGFRDKELIVTTSGERRGDFADVSMCARMRGFKIVRKTD